MRTIVLIPAFNEARSIGKVIGDLPDLVTWSFMAIAGRQITPPDRAHRLRHSFKR